MLSLLVLKFEKLRYDKRNHNNVPLLNCLLRMSIVASFKHLLDSRGVQITAYICMQLAGRPSSFIYRIIHVTSQSFSLCIWALQIPKNHRKNIFTTTIETR